MESATCNFPIKILRSILPIIPWCSFPTRYTEYLIYVLKTKLIPSFGDKELKQFWVLTLFLGILIVPGFGADEPGYWSEVPVQNMDFETSITFWDTEPLHMFDFSGSMTIVYQGTHALKMWAHERDDNQLQHRAISVEPGSSYNLSGWVNVPETNGGGYAFLSMAFIASDGTWVAWPESEYINFTTDWINIHVVGVCPENAVKMKILCRVRGNGGSVTAYFDYLGLKFHSAGRSYMSYTLVLGILGIALLIVTPLYTIYRLRKKDHTFLVGALLLIAIGIVLVIAWLLS